MPTKRQTPRLRGSSRDRIADLLMHAIAPLSTDAIAAKLHVTRGSVTACLADLETAGWVERTRAEKAGEPDRWAWRHQAAA